MVATALLAVLVLTPALARAAAAPSPFELPGLALNTPAIATDASPQSANLDAATVLMDSAMVVGRVSPGAGATVTFRLYGPSDPTCAGLAVHVETVAYPVENSPVTTPGGFTPTEAGTYRWVASYSGDANNFSASGVCGDQDEETVVSRSQPTLSTTASPGGRLGLGNLMLSDTAAVSGRVSAQPGAMVTFKLYGPDDGDCSGPLATPAGTVTLNGDSVAAPAFRPSKAGTYRWVASYSGDGNNDGVEGRCDDPGESAFVERKISTVVPKPSGPITIGSGDLTVRASVPERSAPDGGTIDFTLYGPTSTACGGPVATTRTGIPAPALNTDDTPPTTPFMPTTAGTYYWKASYSGDASNTGANVCSGPVVVDRAMPALATTASPQITVGSGSLSDTVTVTGRVLPGPGATIDFTLHGPNDPTCAGPPVFTQLSVSVSGTGTASAVPGFTPQTAGMYQWKVTYSGDDNNKPRTTCDASNRTQVERRTTTISTKASSAVSLGAGGLTDEAALGGAIVPSGTIDFRLYAPSDPACAGAPVLTSLVAVPAGGGTVASGVFTPHVAGMYRWIASYSGDANNSAVTTPCGAANETAVDRATPSLVTTASPPVRVGSGSLFDRATVLGRVNPQPGATIDFFLYGPGDPACGRPPAFTLQVAYPELGMPTVSTIPAYVPTAPGTHRWRATYSGDVNNAPASGACGDRDETTEVAAADTPVTPGGSGTDADGDGFPAGIDCNDADPATHPGAVDARGDGIDTDCAPEESGFRLLDSTITLTTERLKGLRPLLLTRLTVRPAITGSAVRLSCAGGRTRCRGFRTVSRAVAKNAAVRGFSSLLPKKKLLPGARFEVRVTKQGYIGRVLALTIYEKRNATRSYLCLRPGSKRPGSCPLDDVAG